MRRKGSISIFFSLVFVMVAALILTITESARSFSQRFYMQLAADSAMESLFSQYHRPLWERYRILGLEYRDDGDLIDEFYNFILPYLECEDLFPVALSPEEIYFSEETKLSGGTAMEEEILEYMKYGIAGSFLHFAGKEYGEDAIPQELTEVFKRSEEGGPTDRLQRDYQLDSKDLERMEKVLLDISKACQEEKRLHDAAGAALSRENADAFHRESEKLRKQLEKHKALVKKFQEAVGILEEKVQALRDRFEKEKGELGEEASEIINAEISEYESYVSEKGKLRAEIESMTEKAESLILLAENMELEVEEFEEWVSEAWDNLDEDEDEDEIYDAIQEFYEEAEADWSGFSMITYRSEVSELNQEVKHSLDQIRVLSEGKLLDIVLPGGAVVPSKESVFRENPLLHPGSDANLLEIALLGEYSLRQFNTYHYRNQEKHLPNSGSRQLEVEYLLSGEESDYENLTKVVERLLFLRELMNLTFLYKTPEMRESARSFVGAILCVTGNPLLISVLTFFVLGVWAYGQALVDVRTLLSDGRVPVMHSRESFSLSLEGLLRMGQGKAWESNSESTHGLSYKDYLRTFLFGDGLKSQERINLRMQNAMERNLRYDGEDASVYFSFYNCLYGAAVSAAMDSGHILLEQGIVSMAIGEKHDSRYSFELQSYYKYRNELL